MFFSKVFVFLTGLGDSEKMKSFYNRMGNTGFIRKERDINNFLFEDYS